MPLEAVLPPPQSPATTCLLSGPAALSFPPLCHIDGIMVRSLWSSAVSPQQHVLKIHHVVCACVRTELRQSCPTLCDPMHCSPPGSSVYGILQARMLEWLPCPPPVDLPDPGMEPTSLMAPALAGSFFTTSTT